MCTWKKYIFRFFPYSPPDHYWFRPLRPLMDVLDMGYYLTACRNPDLNLNTLFQISVLTTSHALLIPHLGETL